MRRRIIECPMIEYELRTHYLRHKFYASAITMLSTSIINHIIYAENTQPGDTFVIPGILSLKIIGVEREKLLSDTDEDFKLAKFLAVVEKDQPTRVFSYPPGFPVTIDHSEKILFGATLEEHILLVLHADEVLHGFGQDVELFYDDPFFAEYFDRIKEWEHLGAISREWMQCE